MADRGGTQTSVALATLTLTRKPKGASVAVARAPVASVSYPGASLAPMLVASIARRCVAEVLDCDPLMLLAKPRGSRRMADARRFAMHLVHIVAGRTHEEVARTFGRTRSTASHHFEGIEDLRDIPAFETFLGVLEDRYALLLQLAELKPKAAWRVALERLQAAMDAGYLEGDAYRAAEYMAATWREDGR